MELRLQQFVDSVEQLSDIRNLDKFNPIIFQIEKPLTSTRFTIAGSKIEPSYLGIPVNTTWVVLDPSSPYYRKPLKLKDTINPDTVTNLVPVSSSVELYWHLVRTYEEIFEDAQYFIGQVGPRGPVGPTGPSGTGGSGDPIAIMAAFKQYAGTLAIKGPAAVTQGQTKAYELELTTVEADANGALQSVIKPVLAAIHMIGAVPANVAMSSANNLAVGTLAENNTVKLFATYVSWANVVEATLDVALQKALPVSMVVNGAASIYAGDTSPYTATITYDDGSTSTASGLSWSSSVPAAATVSASGVLTGINPISADTTTTLTASLTTNGVTLTATKEVLIKKLVVQSMSITGSSSLNTGATAQYNATVVLNSGRSMAVTPIWSVSDTNLATIIATGLLTGVLSGSVTLTAAYTLAGASVPFTATKAVSVLAVAVPVYPYYGTGVALPTDWQAFVTALPNRGLTGAINTDIAIDNIGQTNYMYFAYPKSYGKAQFFDKLSQFYGGWGGAGNSGAGPSTASLAAGADTPVTTTITVGGVAMEFYVYRTDFANLGLAADNKWLVTAAP